MSQGFGQRSGTQREGLRAIHGVKFERTTSDDELNGGSSKLRRMVFWIGAGALMVGIYVGTNGSGQGLNKFWKKEAAPTIAEAYVPSGAKDVALDQVNKICRSRGDATGNDAIRQAVAYVSCLAAENPRRLCQVAHRTHLLAAMKNYYHLQTKTRDRDIQIKTDPQVTEALRALVLNGYVPRRDILAAGPSDLEAALRNVEPAKKSGC